MEDGMMNVNARRKMVNHTMLAVTFLCAVVTLIPLFSIFIYVISRGISSVNLDFFLHLPKPVGEHGGGMANAITGTLILVGLACLWSVPIGVMAGVYLAEYGNYKNASIIRFTG